MTIASGSRGRSPGVGWVDALLPGSTLLDVPVVGWSLRLPLLATVSRCGADWEVAVSPGLELFNDTDEPLRVRLMVTEGVWGKLSLQSADHKRETVLSIAPGERRSMLPLGGLTNTFVTVSGSSSGGGGASWSDPLDLSSAAEDPAQVPRMITSRTGRLEHLCYSAAGSGPSVRRVSELLRARETGF